MWDMAQARSLAIQNLGNSLTPVEKVIFGRKYDIPAWVLEGFTILCLLPEYLRIEEARQLTTEDLIKYGVVRETIRCRLMKPLDRNWNGTWTHFQDGATYARAEGYEDGLIYRKGESNQYRSHKFRLGVHVALDPLVKELVETHFLEFDRPMEASLP
jgi:hypothetical protein